MATTITKRTFILAAKQVKDQFANHKADKKHRDLWWSVRENFVVLFAASNSRFDAAKFRDACTPEGADWQAVRAKERPY